MKQRSRFASADEWLPAVVLVWATMFNAVLAIVNAHVLKLSPAAVIGAESITTIASLLLAFLRYRPEMKTWAVLFGLMLLIFTVESLARGDVQAKNVRDVLIIPTYILLGLASPRRFLIPTVCVIHAIVIAVGLFEALDTEGYARLFDVQSYYINTRGYDDDNFWNKQSDLFVSAIRPGERIFLSFLDLHRLSSVFLEPVSLGNYCCIITAFICACFRRLSYGALAFLIVGNVLVLIGCDGRLAGLSSIAIIAAALIAPYLPRGAAALYLPLTLALAFAAVYAFGLRAGPDDLPGRVALTVELLRQYELPEYFGLSDRFVWLAVDSGIAYLVNSQTILGFALIWAFIVLGASEKRADQVRYTHGIVTYLSLAMLVSFSMLTVKTAALMWFAQGTLQRREERRGLGIASLARPANARPPPARAVAPQPRGEAAA
jgi:putative polymerase